MFDTLRELIGTPPINPYLFYSGKLSGYLLWVWYLLACCFLNSTDTFNTIAIASLLLFGAGITLLIVSWFRLGDAIRLGLPRKHVRLKTGGIYRISRNPIYLAFAIFSVSAMLYLFNITALLLGLYSIVIYHFIILGEERFLKRRFGEEYLQYMHRVPRYL